MTLVGLAGATRLAFGIDVQHDPRDFSPIGTFGVRIEQTKIRNCVFMIVGRQNGVRRRGIRDIRIKRKLLHDISFNSISLSRPVSGWRLTKASGSP